MTVTDELRRMLDERGVEWDYGITGATTTRFSVNGIDLTFTPMRDGLVCSTILTPAQAIAATLGDADATATRQGDADERNKPCWECPAHKEFDELRSFCCIRHDAAELGIEVDE